MGVFLVISTSKIVDRKKYEAYVKQARPIIEGYGGTYILQSGNVIASKDWETEKIVIISFKNKEQLDHCFHSSEYQQIVHLRETSIESRFVMIEA